MKPAYTPEDYSTVSPYLVVNGASATIAFLKRAFGATEQARHADPSGLVRHSEVRIGECVVMVSDPLAQATAKSAEWIDRRAFQIEKVKMLEVRYPGGEGWRLERAGENAEWKLAGAKPGEKVDSSRANAATYSLGLLDLADVAPRDSSPEATGLDKPIRISATTLGKVSYAVRVGNLAGENYYVMLESGGAAKDKAFAQRVLLIPKSRLEDTLKKRAELIEKKDTKK